MQPFGPEYCETPALIDGIFPVEPWNAISSFVIVAYGLLTLVLAARMRPPPWLLLLLGSLLVLNGAGSVLWHGLRTRWALALDVWPALILVALAAFLWARKVAPLWQVLLMLALLIGTPFLGRYIEIPLPGGWAILRGGVIVIAGIWLVIRTVPVNRSAAITGALALVFALIALTARTLDPQSCAHLAQGSHFLWHIFLSTAAFMLMVTLMRLGYAPASGSRAP
jgi:predicted membrane channel-forming protein YqfA (hemolysin III family)